MYECLYRYRRGIKLLRKEYSYQRDKCYLRSVSAPEDGKIEYFLGCAVNPRPGCGPLAVYTCSLEEVPLHQFATLDNLIAYECIFLTAPNAIKFWTPTLERVTGYYTKWSFATHVVLTKKVFEYWNGE